MIITMMTTKNLEGQSISIVGTVEEHLAYNNKEWIKIRFPDGSTVIVNLKSCEVKLK